MNENIVKKIIEYGTYAPSGDNSQPWRFVIQKEHNYSVLLYSLPSKDNPILNIHQGGTLIAHGAVILNIKIASESFGYKTIIQYFPDTKDKTLIAKISFEKKELNKDTYNLDLIECIKERNTNRRKYEKYLEDSIINQLKIKDEKSLSEIKFFSKKEEKEIISNITSISEEVILETKELHNLLFKDVIWTQKEELKKRSGLFIKTLEFNPIQFFVFWLCRKWKNISYLNKIGFSKFVGKQNSKVYKFSGVMGLILISSKTPQDYLSVGENMQHLWLKCQNLGLSFQPLTGIFFLNERIKSMGIKPISSDNASKISEKYEDLRKFFKLSDKNIVVIAFRIGKSKKPSARSSRLKPNIVLK